jgi:hypothetical protein
MHSAISAGASGSPRTSTVRTRLRYQIVPRVWVAGGAEYGSGPPFRFEGIQEDATAQFGQTIADRVNFGRGRAKPNLSLDASVGADLWKTDRFTARLQADAENINNRFNLLDFAGLFSGAAIEPPRSYALRLTRTFWKRDREGPANTERAIVKSSPRPQCWKSGRFGRLCCLLASSRSSFRLQTR